MAPYTVSPSCFGPAGLAGFSCSPATRAANSGDPPLGDQPGPLSEELVPAPSRRSRARRGRSRAGGLAGPGARRHRHRAGAPPPPLDLGGTPFRGGSGRTLTLIPRAAARELCRSCAPAVWANARSVRAVAQACGANTIALAIPLPPRHTARRLLRGYRWALSAKSVAGARKLAVRNLSPLDNGHRPWGHLGDPACHTLTALAAVC